MLTLAQSLAKMIGARVRYGKNTWFCPDINHPDNITLYLRHDTIIALGAIKPKHLPMIAKEAVRPHLTNTFAPPLDKIERR